MQENAATITKEQPNDTTLGISFYQGRLRSTIGEHQRLLELMKNKLAILSKRLQLGKIYEFKSQEIAFGITTWAEVLIDTEIAYLKTGAEIATLESIITEKQQYFNKYAKAFESDLNEANANWDRMVEKVMKMKGKSASVDAMIHAIQTQDVTTDLDKRVFIYKRLQGFL